MTSTPRATCISRTSRSRRRSIASGRRWSRRARCSRCRARTSPIDEALGRVTAEAVFARISVPHYHAAAMDGIAVRAEDTLGAQRNARRSRCRSGRRPTGSTPAIRCRPSTNAVIMAEHVQDRGDGRSRSWRPSRPGSTCARWARTSSRPSSCCPRTTRWTPSISARSSPRATPASASGAGRASPSCRPARSSSSPARPLPARRHHRLQLGGAGRPGARVGRRAEPPADHARRSSADPRARRRGARRPRRRAGQRRLVGRLGGLHRRHRARARRAAGARRGDSTRPPAHPGRRSRQGR